MTKHTPGPWQVDNYRGRLTIADEHWNIVAASVIETADAPLIAAAPELLDCVRMLLSHADHLQSTLSERESDRVFTDMQKARAVINKATGEQT
jgi:small nuclear ribonucleoprotein (snRNP)-like protein